MGYFHRALILCTVIYLVDICTLSSGFEDGYTDLDFAVKENPVTLLDKKIGPNGTVLFGYCERNSKLWNFWRGVFTSSLKCNIAMHKLPLNEKEPPKKKCPIELKGEDIRAFSLEHIGNDRAIIQYYETKSKKNYFKLMLIDMNTCHTIWYENLDVEYLGHLITSEDGFDIVTSDSNACDYHKLCLISFNKKGDKIRNPIAFPIKARIGYQVDTLLTNEGLEYFVASSRNANKFELSHIDSLGIKTSARRVYSIPEHNISTSNDHGRFGFCSAIGSDRYQCMQLNSDDRIILNQTISLSSSAKVLKVHNTPDNGLIIFISECTEGPKERSCESLNALKIDQSGEEHRSIVRHGRFSCNRGDGDTQMIAFKNDSEYCLYLSCFINISPKKMKLQFKKECIPENYLRDYRDIALTTPSVHGKSKSLKIDNQGHQSISSTQQSTESVEYTSPSTKQADPSSIGVDASSVNMETSSEHVQPSTSTTEQVSSSTEQTVVSSDYIHSSTEHADSSSMPSTNASKSTEQSQPSKDSDEPITDRPESSNAPVDPSFEVNFSSSKPEYSSTEAVDKAITSISTSTEKVNNDVEDADTTTQQVNVSTDENASTVKPIDAFPENVDQSSKFTDPSVNQSSSPSKVDNPSTETVATVTEAISQSNADNAVGSSSPSTISPSVEPVKPSMSSIDADSENTGTTTMPNSPSAEIVDPSPNQQGNPSNESDNKTPDSGSPQSETVEEEVKPLSFTTESVSPSTGRISSSSSDPIDDTTDTIDASTDIPSSPINSINPPSDFVFPTNELNTSEEGPVLSREPRDLSARQLNQPIKGVESTEDSLQSSTEHIQSSNGVAHTSTESVDLPTEQVNVPKEQVLSAVELVHTSADQTATSIEPIALSTQHVEQSSEGVERSVKSVEITPELVEPTKIIANSSTYHVDSTVTPTAPSTEPIERKSDESVHFSTLPTDLVNKHVEPAREIVVNPMENINTPVVPLVSSTERIEHSSEHVHEPTLPTEPVANIDPVKQIADYPTDHNVSSGEPIASSTEHVDHSSENAHAPSLPTDLIAELLEPVKEINHAIIDHVESLIAPVELIDQIVDSLTEDLNPPNKYVNPLIENVEPAVEHVNPIILLGWPLIEPADHTVIKLGYPVIKPVESDNEPDNQSIRSNEFDLHTKLPSKQSPALVYPPLVRESDVIPSRIRPHFYRSPKLPSRRHRRRRYHRTVQSPRQFRGALGLRSGFIY